PPPGTRTFAPVLMSSESVTTLQQWSSSRSPPDASRTPFPHRSPRRSSANAACGGLRPSPIGRSRRANHPPSLVEHCLDPANRLLHILSGELSGLAESLPGF